MSDGLSLCGTVTTIDDEVRVTVTIVDNRTRELIWTSVFLDSAGDEITTTNRIARDIVASAPGIFPAQVSGVNDVR